MPALVEIDRDAATLRVVRACADRHEVAAALLFGSSLDQCRPDSDIDVAAIPRPVAGLATRDGFRAGLRLEQDLEAALGDLDGHPFHVTVLDAEQSLFAMAVLERGRVCCVSDAVAYADFIERVAQAYRQNAPRYRTALREARAEAIFR